MKRLTEDEMAARYGQPDAHDESIDEQLIALIKALPEPGLPAGFVQNTTERLLQVHQQQLRRRRSVWLLMSITILVLMTGLGIFGYFLSLPIREVVAVIIRYKWVCIFATATVVLFQYLDGRAIEARLKKEVNYR